LHRIGLWSIFKAANKLYAGWLKPLQSGNLGETVQLKWFSRLNLARQFLVLSAPVMLLCALLVGSWVARKVEAGVAYRLAGMTSMHLDSLLEPHVQSLKDGLTLSPAEMDGLGQALRSPAMNEHIVGLKVWRRDGMVLFSNIDSIVGRQFPVGEGLIKAFAGDVHSEVSDLKAYENAFEASKHAKLIETYAPLHAINDGRVIAVYEFYHRTDELDRESARARFASWAVVLGSMGIAYLLVFGLVHQASRTIESQQTKLGDQVQQLTAANEQISHLHERVRRAGLRSASVNEGFLRGVAADLHDGPGQDMGYALMQLKALGDAPAICPQGNRIVLRELPEYQAVLSALQSSVTDLRAVSSGLRLPDIAGLSLVDVVERAVRDFEAKANTRVDVRVLGDRVDPPTPVCITLYRVLQESLSNGLRHGHGRHLRVRLEVFDKQLILNVSDSGPGFDVAVAAMGGRLGLLGMRERVEMIGGQFDVDSRPGQGTLIQVCLPLEMEDPEINLL
jgi:signal transduction histidine kinase